PAIILRTTNGGKSWTEAFRDDRADIFLDAIDFDGRVGYALGDPINGLFQLFWTTDKGRSWKDVSDEMVLFADEEEVAFAASGSSIQLYKNTLFIGTGGKYSSIFAYNPKLLRVDKYDCPILSGEGSAGIFAIDFWDTKYGIAVGGNYMRDQENSNNVLLTRDGGMTWNRPQSPVSGYKSDVQFINENIVLATGTSGTDISRNGGQNWKKISDISFNVLAKSKNGKTVYFAGSNGDIYKLTLD
ncbi:MAG TPA: oxidoreductase, partial [Sphingobacterium sp.]|nr:oxidoreductase [Sphingobacterium sp.]